LGADQEVSAVKRVILGSLLVLSLGWLPQVAAGKSEHAGKMQVITVSIHDQAGVPEETILEAEKVATRIFEQAGIRLAWLDCPTILTEVSMSQPCGETSYPQHLHLGVLSRSRGLSASTIGISFLTSAGEGCYADIFYEPTLEVQGSEKGDLGALLGHAAAHELGHLLLGTNSHSVKGLMRGHWEGPELHQIRSGTLFFSDIEARRMRGKISTRCGVSRQVLGR
jgi:hypothetical protein